MTSDALDTEQSQPAAGAIDATAQGTRNGVALLGGAVFPDVVFVALLA